MSALTAFGRLPWNGTPLSGAGPHALINNAINLFDDSAADAFTMNMPPNPVNDDEVWLCEIGGVRNPVTLAGNGNNVTEWATIDVIAASVVLANEGLIVGYKFLGFAGAWKRIVSNQDQNWSPRNQVSSAITLRTNDIVKYDGSATFTITLPATPVRGTVIGVAESQGSGAGVVTVSGNGTNLINDAGASVASMALSIAYAYRQWRFDNQANLWLRTHPAI